MARTYRRRGGPHRRAIIISKPWSWSFNEHGQARHDPQDPESRRRLAYYRSDAAFVFGEGSAPRWFRKIYKRRIRMFNQQQLSRWLRYGDFDPVFRDKHHHNAHYDWW